MAAYYAEIDGDDEGGWSASVPDLHVFATGTTRDEAIREAEEAARWHVEGLVEDGLRVPEPSPTISVEIPPRSSETVPAAAAG